ncbi:GNAT family N-acetyltransferase [Aminiphilus circumscriptus]|jgi:ribosomal-protein-alanine N-acetyltransferase|uniref:GNAT family N-acetyltransferase n=1 Tax=Aminiphilus circumscriptus TaxID=290732 RepID=UPI0004AEFC4F|nr:GNAT family N-acetyltransferase [Aminiphilus circumscriptus]
MGTFPELETPRLRLRYLVADDAEELLCRWSDPEVMEYLTLDPTRTLAEARDMVDLLGGLFDRGMGIRWGITCKTQGALLGTCGFHNVRWETSAGRAGIRTRKGLLVRS